MVVDLYCKRATRSECKGQDWSFWQLSVLRILLAIHPLCEKYR